MSFVSSGALSTKRRHHPTSAVAYGMQELALGGLRAAPQRQLRQFAQQLKANAEVRIRPGPELKPGTRLLREWRGRTYEVLVLEAGFLCQGTCYRSLSALARKITGTAWSGPLFFGLKPHQSVTPRSCQIPGAVGKPAQDRDATE